MICDTCHDRSADFELKRLSDGKTEKLCATCFLDAAWEAIKLSDKVRGGRGLGKRLPQ